MSGDQVNDFNPGIEPSGLFWTIAVPPSAIEIAGASGHARFHLENLVIPDVRWQGGRDRLNVRDETFDFAGGYVASDATISFSVVSAGVTYTSSAAGQKTAACAVGHERNGVYFT
jgi:hypothetical protein